MKTNLKGMTLSELKQFFSEMGEKVYRARQVFRWIYSGVSSFEDMTDLPKELRERLAVIAEIGCLEIVKSQISKTDGTRKYVFKLSDGNLIESVFMKYKFGNSICISSQAGCRMGCLFCASGKNGLIRNLTAGEMVDQIISTMIDTGEKINHIVVMGTGEPFDNYEQVSRFISLVNDKQGLCIGMRSITVSTCGLVPAIKRFSEDFPQVNLAVSLHGSKDAERNEIMPIGRTYPLDEVLGACRNYTQKTGRRVTFEYALIRGKNDQMDCADELAEKLRGMLCHVNLIPLNPIDGTKLEGTGKEIAFAFSNRLLKRGIPVTIRRELGMDIDAACGQLRLKTADW